MLVTKLFLLLTLTCFLYSKSHSQKTEFSSDGKIVKLGLKNYALKEPGANLRKLDTAKKNEYCDNMLKKQIAETIKNIDDSTTGLRKFYAWLWDSATITILIADLTKLSESLEAKEFNGRALSLLSELKTPLDSNLLKKSRNKPYSFSTLSPYSGKLIYKDPFNTFIIEYYNSVYSRTSPLIKSFSLAQWVEYSTYLSKQKDKVDSLLIAAYGTDGDLGIELFKAIRTFTRELNIDTAFNKAKNVLKNDWFKKWIWMHSGLPRLNPLNFTTETFLQKYPEYDAKKATIYEEYLDSVIKKYKLYDTVGKLEQFKKILNEKGTGKTQFKIKKRLDAMEANDEETQKLLVTEKILNEIKIPEIKEDDYSIKQREKVKIEVTQPSWIRKLVTDSAKEKLKTARRKVFFYNYSFSKEDKFEADDRKKFPTEPVRAGEIKKLVVHNIPAGSKVELKVKTTDIADRSAFQQTTDTIFGLAAKIAERIIEFSAFNLSSNFIRENNANISVNRNSRGLSVAHVDNFADEIADSISISPIPIKKVIESLLEVAKIYDKEIFDSTVSVFFTTNSFSPRILDSNYNTTRHGDFIELFAKAYKKKLKKEEQKYFEKAQTDSLHLCFMHPAFDKSSLPPGKLEPSKDKSSLYYSEILTTDASDDPVKNDMQIIGRKEKDSVIVAKFSYKIGKNYRFQFGAGIAYTFRNFIQSKAKQENGQIVIENTAQNYRLIVGLHVHFGKGLFLQDNKFFGKFKERSSFYVGVGIPKPLENIYTGYAYDLWPGFKLTAGFHIYRNDEYKIQNNSIIEKRLKYQVAGPFGALLIDPTSLLKALNVLK